MNIEIYNQDNKIIGRIKPYKDRYSAINNVRSLGTFETIEQAIVAIHEKPDGKKATLK